MEELSLTPFNYKTEEFKTSIRTMKISIWENNKSKRCHYQEKIRTKFKFKVQHLMKFSLFLKEYSFKIRVKAQFNRIHLSLRTSCRTSKEADNQLKRRPQALKAEHYKCKNKTRRKFLKVGTLKKLLNNLETTSLNLRKLN